MSYGSGITAGRETCEELRCSPWLVLVLVAFGEFMVVLDATIVNVALPSIQHDLGFAAGDLQWVVNGYALFLGGFLLLGGRSADLFGRKRVFLLGLAVFTAASVANALARSPEVLIAGRALQGLGAAMISPAALSIITSTFPVGRDRTKALSVWAAIAAGGGGVGLLLGGLLTETLSWEWVFLINLPVGLAALVAGARLLPESRLVGHRGYDVLGAVFVTAGLLVLVYAIVKIESWGLGDARVYALAAGSALLLAAFTVLERRLAEPLVSLSIFRIRPISVANGVAVAVAAALFPLFFFGSMYMQEVKGFTPIESGAGFLPFTLSVLTGAGLAQASLPRFGAKTVATFGLLLGAAGLAYLTGLSPASGYVTGFVPGLIMVGFGIGNVWLPLTMAATGAAGADRQGLASGLANTSQQIGGALGLAVLSTIAIERTEALLAGPLPPDAATRASAMVDGFALAFAVGAGILTAGAVAMIALMRRNDVAVSDEETGEQGPAPTPAGTRPGESLVPALQGLGEGRSEP